jgi:hypothetical protein
MNGTLQDRLVKELREAGISTLAEANIFLQDIFLPTFNAQFMVVPRWSSNLHIPLRVDERERLDALFTEQKQRKVQNDFTVRFGGKIFQIYRNKAWGSLVYHGESVIIEKRMDLSIHIRNKIGNYLLSKELEDLPAKNLSINN